MNLLFLFTKKVLANSVFLAFTINFFISFPANSVYFHEDVLVREALSSSPINGAVLIVDPNGGVQATGLIIQYQEMQQTAILTTSHLEDTAYHSILWNGKTFPIHQVEKPRLSYEIDRLKMKAGDCRPITYGDIALAFIKENEEWSQQIRLPLTTTNHILTNYTLQEKVMGEMLGGGPLGKINPQTQEASLLRTTEGIPIVGCIAKTTMKLQEFPIEYITSITNQNISCPPLVFKSTFLSMNPTPFEGIGTKGDSGSAVFIKNQNFNEQFLLAIQSGSAPPSLSQLIFCNLYDALYHCRSWPVIGKLFELTGLNYFLIEKIHARGYGSTAFYTPLGPWKEWIEKTIQTYYSTNYPSLLTLLGNSE